MSFLLALFLIITSLLIIGLEVLTHYFSHQKEFVDSLVDWIDVKKGIGVWKSGVNEELIISKEENIIIKNNENTVTLKLFLSH